MSIITLPTRPGSSGSMIIDADGKMFGIVLERTKGITSVGYAATLQDIKSILLN